MDQKVRESERGIKGTKGLYPGRSYTAEIDLSSPRIQTKRQTS